ncbi:MAG: TolC family protein [Flavobacteriales bacterium]|nr:TolC family protein [Flavobacteriales bacterium]
MRIILLIIGFTLLSVVNAQDTKVWTLKECVDYALENNISIKQSELDKNISIEDVKVAKWNFAPNLNANASQSFNFGSSIGVSGARIPADFRSNNFGINSTINLFDGFANVHTLSQAKIGVKVQEAAITKMKNDISLNVVNSYLQILFAKEQLKVVESQLTISGAEVNRIKELVDAGVLPQGDLLNIESNLATDNQNVIVAQNTLTIASLRLAQLLQLDIMDIKVEDISVDIQNQAILSNDVGAIYNKANETFPEIKLAELNILNAEKSVKISRANFYPSLTASFGMNTAYQHRQSTTDFSPFLFSDQIDDNLGQSIVFSLNIPIFNRYQFRSNVNKSKINVEKVQYNLESERLRLRETIQTAYTDALASSKSYDAAITSVTAQQKAFDYSQERFKAGAINSFDFNQTKNNLLNAQSQLIQSKYDFMFKLKVLEFYFGVPFIGE